MSHQSDLIASDIEEYLRRHEQKEILRFLTCAVWTTVRAH